MFGNGSFHKFYDENKWVENYLPNKTVTDGLSKLHVVKKPTTTKITEYFLDSRIGDWLDAAFLRITYKKWKIKFNHLEERQFNVAMKSTKNISKHHPLNFQHKVIDRLNNRYDELREKHNIHIAKENA